MPRANGITRQEIMDCIKMQGTLSAEELAGQLGISQVAVRQHLSSLEAEGIVNVGIARHGLGRPSHRYALTARGDEMFPRRYETLTNALLNELRLWQGDGVLAELMTRMRDRDKEVAMSRMREKSLEGRMKELAHLQSENGYMAEIIPDGPGRFLLVKRNCAVCAVARNHPEVCCQQEASFFESLLGEVDVVLNCAIVQGEQTCRFTISDRSAEEAPASFVGEDAK